MANLFEWETTDKDGKAVTIGFTKVSDISVGTFEDSVKTVNQLAANFFVLKEAIADKSDWPAVRAMDMTEFNKLLNAWNNDLS